MRMLPELRGRGGGRRCGGALAGVIFANCAVGSKNTFSFGNEGGSIFGFWNDFFHENYEQKKGEVMDQHEGKFEEADEMFKSTENIDEMFKSTEKIDEMFKSAEKDEDLKAGSDPMDPRENTRGDWPCPKTCITDGAELQDVQCPGLCRGVVYRGPVRICGKRCCLRYGHVCTHRCDEQWNWNLKDEMVICDESMNLKDMMVIRDESKNSEDKMVIYEGWWF